MQRGDEHIQQKSAFSGLPQREDQKPYLTAFGARLVAHHAIDSAREVQSVHSSRHHAISSSQDARRWKMLNMHNRPCLPEPFVPRARTIKRLSSAASLSEIIFLPSYIGTSAST